MINSLNLNDEDCKNLLVDLNEPEVDHNIDSDYIPLNLKPVKIIQTSHTSQENPLLIHQITSKSDKSHKSVTKPNQRIQIFLPSWTKLSATFRHV